MVNTNRTQSKSPATATPGQRWTNVADFLRAHYVNPDIEAAKIVYAAYASHVLKEHDPCWLMLIAPPGSLKTELLKAAGGLPGVHMIDQLTQNTLISGQIGNQDDSASLLYRIGKSGELVVPDFSTILSLREDQRKELFSQLRRVYDGHLRREFGTKKGANQSREWKGRLTMICAVTPEIDRHYGMLSALGDRFLYVRWPRAGGSEAGLAALEQNMSVPLELRKHVHALLQPILGSKVQIIAPLIPSDLKARLVSLTEFTAQVRAYVPINNSGEIVDRAQVESNTRLPKELAQLLRGAALLDGRTTVSEEDFQLALRVARDSMPPIRWEIINSLAHDESPYSTGLPKASVSRQLSQLEHIGLLDSFEEKDDEDRTEKNYLLTERAIELLGKTGLVEDETVKSASERSRERISANTQVDKENVKILSNAMPQKRLPPPLSV